MYKLMKLKISFSSQALPWTPASHTHFKWYPNLSKNELLILPTPSHLSLPQPHKWELDPLIWENLHTFSWHLSIYLPCTAQILLFPLLHILNLLFLISPTPATLAHLGLLQWTPQVSIFPILCPNIILHAAARMIFLKPMTTHVTYLIKTFQWLSISLKIQAKVLTNAYKSKHDLLPLWMPSQDSPLGWRHFRLSGFLAGWSSSTLVTLLAGVICTSSFLYQDRLSPVKKMKCASL